MYGGDLYVGSLTIMQSVLQLFSAPLTGFTQGVQPIISYNYGAGKFDRVKKLYRSMIAVSFTISLSLIHIFWTAYLNTIIRAALGTGLSVLLYIIGAYPLSKKYLPHKKAWTLFVIFTMYFSGGLIPSCLLYTSERGIPPSRSFPGSA